MRSIRRYRQTSRERQTYRSLEELSFQLVDEVAAVLKTDHDIALQQASGEAKTKLHRDALWFSTALVESFNLSQGDPGNQELVLQWLQKQYPQMRMTNEHIALVRYMSFQQIRNRLQLRQGDLLDTQLHPYYRTSSFLGDFLFNIKNFESNFSVRAKNSSSVKTDDIVRDIAANMIQRDGEFPKRTRRMKGKIPRASTTPLDLNPYLSFSLDYMLGGKYTKFDPYRKLFADMQMYILSEAKRGTLKEDLVVPLIRLAEQRFDHEQKDGIAEHELTDIFLLLEDIRNTFRETRRGKGKLDEEDEYKW